LTAETQRVRGRFITFEGGEGAGKSTQVDLLAQALGGRGISIRTTREPGGSPGAEDIRALLVHGDAERWDGLTEALLHYAARRDHLLRTIRPALAAGDWVICDRFNDSTIAYQGYGHGTSRADLDALYRMVAEGLKPDLTIILDLPVSEGLSRAGKRGGAETRYENMNGGFHDRMRQGFLEIARQEPERCVVVAATDSPEAVHGEILRVVKARFPDAFA